MRNPPKSHNKPTLANVAHEAGVSIATASYVLSKRVGVTISAATRDRVEECARRLGYRRNAFAAALRSGTSHEIGLFSMARPEGADADVAFALAEAASARGLYLIVHIGRPEGFQLNRFEAVITVGSVPVDAIFDDGDKPPFVEIGGSNSHCQIHGDNFGGARRAIEYLLSLGHRRIAHFAGPQSELASQERLRGFLDAVHEAGLRMDATPVFHSLADLANLLGSQSKPTAVLAFDDQGAVAVYRCARAAGLRVPSDLSVIGFDDESFAARLQPPLTTVRIEPELIANAALELLERQIERKSVPAQTLIPANLVIRESTSP